MEYEELGSLLRETRTQKGYTLLYLAQKAKTATIYLGEIAYRLKLLSLNSFN